MAGGEHMGGGEVSPMALHLLDAEQFRPQRRLHDGQFGTRIGTVRMLRPSHETPAGVT